MFCMARRIGFIGFDQITALDLVGPLEVFATANYVTTSKEYDPLIISTSGKGFSSEAGLILYPHASFRDAPKFDTIIVPGGAGLRDPKIGTPVGQFLKSRARSTRRIASVCTGLFALGQAGLMDGRKATTHWRFAKIFAKAFPRVSIDANAIYLRDGKFYSSAGITAGIDLCLGLVAEDLGEQTALKVARELVVYLKRPGGQDQFSEPLRFQIRANSNFSDLAGWILRNLDKDLSVPTLASQANLGVRQFSRRFKNEFGYSPAAYIQLLRLNEARKRLPAKRGNLERLAHSVGFANGDAFRRAFERRFGISLANYAERFGDVVK
jgi:transcriptional regulator GlxA family with amidase domain